jgi:hypothetical protein
LLITGVLLLLGVFVSQRLALQVASSWPDGGIEAVAQLGYLRISYVDTSDDLPLRDNYVVFSGPTRRFKWDRALVPNWRTARWSSNGPEDWTTFYDLDVPLWLLSVICLAWPVTSLLLARRRRKGRGFAVEPAADAAPPPIDPPPHHPHHPHHPSNLPPP